MFEGVGFIFRRQFMYKSILLPFFFFSFCYFVFQISGPVFGQSLCLYNTHTHETFKGTYKNASGCFDSKALSQIDYILRDHRTNETHKIESSLLDSLYDLAKILNPKDPSIICFHIISGYRSPKTNEMLRKKSTGVSSNSLHLKGQAIDIRVPGVSLSHVCQAAKSLKRGGVGCYHGPNFVHMDTGRVRSWGN